MGASFYDPGLLEDAPEHHALARALGTLTWTGWDSTTRPVEDRIADFVAAYPPLNPVKYVGGSLRRSEDGTVGPSEAAHRLARFQATDWRPGSLFELAARYGLTIRGTVAPPQLNFEPAEMKETARRRNVRLRVLHGGVDVEPSDMDAAKALLLDREEKQQAARDIRAARAKMDSELMGDPKRRR